MESGKRDSVALDFIWDLETIDLGLAAWFRIVGSISHCDVCSCTLHAARADNKAGCDTECGLVFVAGDMRLFVIYLASPKTMVF